MYIQKNPVILNLKGTKKKLPNNMICIISVNIIIFL